MALRFAHLLTAAAMALVCAGPAMADKIRIGSPYPTTTLDPIRSANAGSIETFGQLYSRLLRVDETGALAPGLAEKWDVSADGTVVTLTLRDAKFSNGDPITADDVVFSLLRVRDTPDSAYPAPMQMLDKAEAVDAHTVKLTLKSAFAPFLGNLEVFNIGIVSKKDVEARGDKAFVENVVTSGPYMVEKWVPNDRLLIAPNPNYWREGYPKNDGAELIEVADSNTRVSMMLSGELDAAREIPWSQVAEVQANENIEMPLEPSTVIYIVLMNQTRAPFDKLEGRQAAAMALDTAAMSNAVTFGAATPANSTLPNALKFYDPTLKVNGFDPAAAKAALEASGYDGREITILITDEPEREKQAVLMQALWGQIGIKSKIEKTDAGTFWTRLTEGDYDATPTWWYNETTDPDLAVRWSVCGTCGNKSYYTNYENAEVDRLVEAGAAERDETKRAQIYADIQRITTTEVADIPLYYPPFANAYSKKLTGLRMTPALQWTLEGAEITK
ncbi:MAG TPA: ABC transporter substrate-binding protein [Albidovulum sp.]|uniref:ABC transporter substrate-binding protein n=1 Tax=Albidovulum sp. TaxID=1872424 RepID=UPI002D0A6D6E|nr:ABC transporter substrate-binding protein [Albidovulum sp.]